MSKNNQFKFNLFVTILFSLNSVNVYSQTELVKGADVFNFKCEDIDILNSKNEKIGSGSGNSIFVTSKEGKASFIDNKGIKYNMTFHEKGAVSSTNFSWGYGDGEKLTSQNYVSLIKNNNTNKIILMHTKKNGAEIKEKVFYFKCS
jgi:hypothetical protein